MAQKATGDILFGSCIIPYSQIFILRKNVYGMINRKPVCKGHVLVCTRRQVAKLQQLSEIETLDLFMTVQEVTKKLSVLYKKPFSTSLQNGKDAGQTVSQVHFHVMPISTQLGVDKEEHPIRSEEDMSVEADQYRVCFENANL